jgi:RNA polymerase sigma-70 factor (ECF subfamily)
MRTADENAFVAAYDDYAEPIFRYCYFKVNDRERARELMQDTFARAWEYLRSGKQIDELRPFLYTVAHHVCVNEVLRKKAFSLDEMREVAGFEPADTLQSPEEDAEAALLMEKLQDLRPSDRELLTLRYVNGLEVKEIARTLGENPNTISVRIKRALAALKEKLDPST